MSMNFGSESNSVSRARRRRRPSGVSRRRKKLNLSFETLEDRRVMSAQSPLGPYPLESTEPTIVSYSSATPEGQALTFLRELERYAAQNTGVLPAIETNSIPTDPLLPHEWYLINTGQQVGNPDFQVIFGKPGEDINVAPVWNQGITGEGVVVAVIDSGVEFAHPDLAGNINPAFQLDALTGDSDASPEDLDVNFINAHGTSVAGIIAAKANDIGGVGVAPDAQIVPIRLIDVGQFEQAFVDAFRFGVDQIDITNNSWGPGIVRGLAGPSPNEVLALRDSVIGPNAGRDGLGVIHLFASGNSGEALDTASYNGWVNSRYTIAVTGVDHTGTYNNVDGTVTAYPESGPSVLVAAPTGSVALSVGLDTGVGSGIVTTDTTGNSGFNQDPDPDNGQEDFVRDFLEDEAYTSRFNGTSAATPVASGAVALMLQANPNLNWRDVQEILVRSARQNAEFDTLADGQDKATGVEYQSTWIMNQVPLFHDPDLFDPLIANGSQMLNPILDPRLTLELAPNGLDIHYAPTPQLLTNGAGFTVSQGRGTNFEQIGYAHGVIDAELAVQLAQQWTTKGQHLPNELSFTTSINNASGGNLPAAELINQGGLNLIVPGGLGGQAGFGTYWDEYFVTPTPNFNQNFPSRGTPLELTVPSPNDMTLENLEITMNISGGTGDALDNVRMILVSPNGTHSELNHYFVDPVFSPPQNIHQANQPELQVNGLNAVSDNGDFLDPGSVDNGGNLVFTFSTNRIWGERSDDALIINPTTGEPYLAPIPGLGGNSFNAVDTSHGEFLTQGWQIYFENYGTTPLQVNSIETVWHGSPIGANTKRVQGLIGIDDNRDDLFNYSRVIQEIVDIDNDPTTLRLGEVQNFIDPNHESMGSNITVLAFRDVNGNGAVDATDILVDQFITGADGNYYFDLVPDDYIIALDTDSLGDFTALDDSLTPNGFLKDYQSQWAISEEFFQVWDYDANLQVPLDAATDAPVPLLDASGNTVEYHVNHINFLLDPGAPPAPEVTFSGQVIADINGDGVFNGSDTVAPGIFVFGDVNRNGRFDSGEEFTSTDVNGNYTLVVPSTVTAVIEVGIQAPVDWAFTNPTSGLREFFTQPGDTVTGVDFAIQPPASGTGTPGSGQPGTILGFVFEDTNEDGIQQASEAGISNVEVFIDNNLSGVKDAGDTVVTTNSFGGYVFTNVPVGTHELRVDLDTSTTLDQTFPIFGLPNVVTIVGESTVSGVRFGFNNSANLDYGDLPDIYGTLFSNVVHNDLTGGARHKKGSGIFFLGSSVDAEINGQPSANALGDDLLNVSDEDGITVDPLVAGGTGRLEAIASRHGGYLQAWVDFNGDGDFNDIINGVSEQIITNDLLDPGLNVINFQIPTTIDAAVVYARFRYGEFGLGPVGLAQVGEVEDYVLAVAAPAPLVVAHGPDFDEDGDVDGADFLAWQRGYGIQTNALAGNGDADSDGAVNGNDLALIQAGLGLPPQTNQAIAAVTASGESSEVVATLSSHELVSSALTTTSFGDSSEGLGSHEQVETLGPRIVQPGFREDLDDSVSLDFSHGRAGETLARVVSIASEHARLGELADLPQTSRGDRSPVASYLEEFQGADLGLALRDRAFAKHDEAIERMTDRHNGDDSEEDDALSVALGEEVVWRLL